MEAQQRQKQLEFERQKEMWQARPIPQQSTQEAI